jgi:hypothetical protein
MTLAPSTQYGAVPHSSNARRATAASRGRRTDDGEAEDDVAMKMVEMDK